MMTRPNDEKSEWRRRLRTRIAGLSAGDRSAASRAILNRLFSLPEWRTAATVLLFVPLDDEPDLLRAAEVARQQGKQAVWPSFDPRSGTYILRPGSGDPTAFPPGHLGIPEPPSETAPVDGKQLDFALVPGIGFTADGHRLGRGKGFLDRLLASVHGFKCGVAFDLQLVAALPVEPHDVTLDCILTPSGEWRATTPRP